VSAVTDELRQSDGVSENTGSGVPFERDHSDNYGSPFLHKEPDAAGPLPAAPGGTPPTPSEGEAFSAKEGASSERPTHVEPPARPGPEQPRVWVKDPSEKTVVKSVGLGGLFGGGVPAYVDVKNDKILRVRPLHYDDEYTLDHIKSWKFERNGVTFQPPLKSLPSPFSLGYKKRATSPNRIKYPLQRVDWDPEGERNPQNRGISKYKRISWDRATDLVAAELRRVHDTYGPFAVLAQADGHAENKSVHAPHGCQVLLHKALGGYTQQVRNPDSWEGWYWGSMHVWGTGVTGVMTPGDNVQKDVSDHTELLLVWGGDPETTPWGFSGQYISRLTYFWSAAGIEQVYICPDLNYGAAIHADKWIPVLPNTDAALQLAVIYTWITEGCYDKDYVATHAVGFDKLTDYVLGEEDGVPKTPEWASSKCGVPEWTIKALARRFAKKTTSIAHYFGGSFIRGPYSHEPARLECVLLGMQGLGKPGCHQLTAFGQPPRADIPMGFGFARSIQGLFEGKTDRILTPHMTTMMPHTKSMIPKTMIEDAILNPPITFHGTGAIAAPVEDQFCTYTFPLPEEEGGTDIHMIWSDTPCRTTCWGEGNRVVEAMRSPKIECFVAQHPWMENDCFLADIILPSNTTFEVYDLVCNMMRGGEAASVGLQERAIEPVGESKSDYEVVVEVAKKLGMEEAVTEGKSPDEWVRHVFDTVGLDDYLSWEDFRDRGYYVFPPAPDWDKDPAGLIKFYEDPVGNPLGTPSGKLEFYSERLARSFPGDEERGPLPKWVERSETHDERLSSGRAAKYPLLVMSNHGRWRVHAQCDDIPWTREAPTCKVRAWDGYMYEPMWINPMTAAERGIEHKDIVKAYNERGAVLAGAYVTERIMPGVVYMDHGARVDWIVPGEIDRGGAINLICPGGIVSKNAPGMASSGYLVEVEKVDKTHMEEWRKLYPAEFAREYEPAAGLVFESIVVDA
jgi:molybdopterin guanine dinucleotide-containing S/N-oxide reductase-like protein